MGKLKRLTALLGVSTLLAFGLVIGGTVAKPAPVYAVNFTSATLVFYCEWKGAPAHPDKVWVEGWNQSNQWVSHQFPAYYTFDDPNYWWWAINSTIYYYATYQGYTDVLQSFVVYGPDGRHDIVGAHVC